MNTIYKILAIAFFLCVGQQAMAQNFITQWNLATAGSGPTQLTFGTATSGLVNYTWQEISPGTASGSGSWSGATLTITGLPTAATIRLQIAPANFQRIIMAVGPDRDRLTQVEQWGSTAWTSMENAFWACANLQVTATDVPNLSGVTNMSQMFRQCTNLNSPSNINSWNTASVSNMSLMFNGAFAFNQNIGSWNTGAVTNMQGMFWSAIAFNQDIGSWNTAAVTTMANMFFEANAFNNGGSNTINNWNTGAVTSMYQMFYEADVFNQEIGAWNTAAVTTMNGMFYATDFNNGGSNSINNWNTGAVTDMQGMFRAATAFNQNIGSWNTSSVTNMFWMFFFASSFNNGGSITINNWNTGAVTNMREMFAQAISFNQNIGSWNTAAVTTMYGMFSNATIFNQNIGAWVTSSVTDMGLMFGGASAFNNGGSNSINNWNTGAVTNLGGMFQTATVFNQNIGSWNTTSVTNMSFMFWQASAFNQNIGLWNTAAVTNMTQMFTSASAFNRDIGAWNTGAVTSMASMFAFATSFNQNISLWNTASVTSMLGMFQSATAFSQNIGAWTLNPALTLFNMFLNSGMDCNNYSATLIGWNANPLTPNGRTLGTTGRQYGTNAVAARAGLIAKGWTILGDTPSGTVCISVPTLSNFTPVSGPIGTTVIITGTNFSTTPTNNIVYFGATRATVSVATASQLTVTVPTGSTFKPITVSVNGLTAQASKPFVVTFAGGTALDNCSFAPPLTIETVSYSYTPTLCDLDGDGKIDLLIPELSNNQLAIFRNTSVSGTPSFAAKIPFTGLTEALATATGDLDGDGKPDIAVANYTNGQLSVYKNLSTPGTISVATRVIYTIPAFTDEVSIADIDGDGKLDLIITASIQGLIVMRNQGFPGVIDASTFAAGVTFATGPNAYPVALGDIDGDGKLDAVVPNANTYTLSVLLNTSTPGTVSFATSVTLTTNTGTPTAGYGTGYVSLGDIDGDSKMDIVAVSNTVTKLSLFRNISTPGSLAFDARFDIATAGIGLVPPLSDLNGDGKLDLVADNGPLQMLVFENTATSGVIDASSFKTPVVLTRASSAIPQLGDIDGDGRNDIISTSTNLQVFRNLVGTISPPTITSFTPSSGPIGTSVTITGTNFSTPFTNTVNINGITATITSSTPTSLTVTIPAGATTGLFEVTIGCNTVTSATSFIVPVPPHHHFNCSCQRPHWHHRNNHRNKFQYHTHQQRCLLRGNPSNGNCCYSNATYGYCSSRCYLSTHHRSGGWVNRFFEQTVCSNVCRRGKY